MADVPDFDKRCAASAEVCISISLRNNMGCRLVLYYATESVYLTPSDGLDPRKDGTLIRRSGSGAIEKSGLRYERTLEKTHKRCC